MPFKIVRNDIACMQVDAIVNSANPEPVIGCGVDLGIHKKAGPELLEARKKIGRIAPGQAVLTPGFGLPADCVIHTVCPLWQGGTAGEVQLLQRCYLESLSLARKHGLTGIAFPLLAAGNLGFPRETALKAAMDAVSSFLMKHDLEVYLVVFQKDVFTLSGKLFENIESFIDEHYIKACLEEEFPVCAAPEQKLRSRAFSSAPTVRSALPELEEMLLERDAGFAETLLHLIEKSGRKNAEIYRRANVDRKLFSKIMHNISYHPSKQTALAFAFALELSLEETLDLIGRAGYTLSHSSRFDIIIEYFLIHREYDLFTVNEVLFGFDQPLLGS